MHMKTLRLSLLSLGGSLISATTLITPVVAQTPDSEPELPSETGSADDLRVSPRGGVGFTTTGPGYEEPFFSLEGFIPLQQSPGNNLTFLEGKLLYSTDSTMGGNLMLGQRFYSSSQDQILGGYIAYDFRDTGNSFFNQIGAGFELLTNKWDFRVNGYLPIGDRRQQVTESFSNPNFEGNFLLLDRDRRFEAAVGGLDLEVGTQLSRLGEGDLRGYAGVYYYNASGGDDGFGIRGRLEARPSDNLRVGLLVQNDPLFDTRVVLSLGANFPGTRPRGAERDSTLARIGESVGRTATITVDEQEEFETITVTNPTTNEAYRFQHVNLGIGNSDGTFESPFATVQEALAVAQPNDIVYVRATIDPGIAAFRIPDNVSILSTGPAQIIDTVEAGNVQLPFSGTGLLPTITGTVALGNNTVLSGFRFLNSTGNAIEGTNVSDATIRDNVITGAAQSGISLSNVTGTTTVANNTITDSNAGISLNNNIGTVDLNIDGNSLSNNLENITVGLVDTAVGTVGVVENTVTGGGIGVGVEAAGNSLLDVNIGSNTVNNTTGTGITVDVLGQAQVDATINDNTLTNNVENITIGLVDTAVGTVGIVENTITGGGLGINVDVAGNSVLTGTIGNNTVNNTTETGIAVDALEQGQLANVTVGGNTLTNNVENIGVGLVDTAVGTVNIVENEVTGGGLGINVDVAGDSVLTGTIGNNTVEDTTQTAIDVDVLEQGQLANVTVSGNTLTNNVENIGVDLTDTATGTVGIVANQVTGGETGISIEGGDNSVVDVNIDGNGVQATTGTAIDVSTLEQTQVNATINNNSLDNNVNGVNVDSTGAAQGTVTVVNNDVTNTLSGVGVAVALANDTAFNVGISNNSVDTPPGTGIIIEASPTTTATFTVDPETIANSQLNVGVAPVIVIPAGTIPIPVSVVPTPTNPIPLP